MDEYNKSNPYIASISASTDSIDSADFFDTRELHDYYNNDDDSKYITTDNNTNRNYNSNKDKHDIVTHYNDHNTRAYINQYLVQSPNSPHYNRSFYHFYHIDYYYYLYYYYYYTTPIIITTTNTNTTCIENILLIRK